MAVEVRYNNVLRQNVDHSSSMVTNLYALGFGDNATYDDLMASDCTSCAVTQDKSAYWHPSLFFQDATTGQFEIVQQEGGMLA